MSDKEHTHDDHAPAPWLAELEAHLWAMRPEVLASLVALAQAGTTVEAAVAEVEPAALKKPGRPKLIQGDIAKVNLKGLLIPGGGILGMLFGLRDPLDQFRSDFREAVGDNEVGAIVLDIDSPGGVTDHIPEVATEIRAARGRKPVIAHVNTMAASAAYWIASQADEIVTTPSGVTGSIGVYAMHRDLSKMQEELGIKTTLVSAGKYKVEGNPFEPLDDDAREHIQEDVNYFYDLFTSDVAKGRGVKQADIKSSYGEGRVLPAKAALAANLVDRVETLGETVARLNTRSRSTTRTAEADAGADDTVTEAEADAGADDDGEQAKLLARLEGHALLQDRAWDKLPV